MPHKPLFIQFFRTNHKVFLPLFSCVFFFVTFFWLNRFFSVSRIELIGYSDIRGLDEISKKNILLLKTNQVEQKLFRMNPLVRQITLEKIYPHTVKVVVRKASLAAQLAIASGYIVISDALRVVGISREQASDLPLIQYYQKLHASDFTIGEVLTKKDISFSVFFIDGFSKAGIRIDQAVIGGLNMIVLIADDVQYIFTTERDKEDQLSLFYSLYAKTRAEGIEYRALDMRFAKPIIKLKK